MNRDIGREAVQWEQVSKLQLFRKPDELNSYLESLGIKQDTPKNILYSFVEERESGSRWWELPAPQVVDFEASVTRLLEDTADKQPFMVATDPNYFVAGMVIELEDGRQVAIRYKCEECELVDPDFTHEIDQETSTELLQEYEVVICNDYRVLDWCSY